MLVAGPTLSVGVGGCWTLGERLHHLCNTEYFQHENDLSQSPAARPSPTLVVLLLLPLVNVQRQLLHPHSLLLLGLLLVEVVGGQVGGQGHVEDLILMSQTGVQS